MLTEDGRTVAHFARRTMQLDGCCGHGRLADAREVHLCKEAALFHVRIGERFTRTQHWTCWHARGFELCDGIGARALGDPFVDALADDLAVVTTRLVARKAWIGQPLGCPDQFCSAAEEGIAVHRDGDPSVLRFVDV